MKGPDASKPSTACNAGMTPPKIPKSPLVFPSRPKYRPPPMKKKKASLTIREATLDDIPALLELNRKAYPVLADENMVWGESHLRSHQRVFPQGQVVAEIKGKIVGAVASLIVDIGNDDLRHHTWAGITDSGYFTNHDAKADTLYGADICVDPEVRGLGIGAALYEARRDLCRRLNKRRILAGGRLWNYNDHAHKMSAEHYAHRVVMGQIRDLVLSFQLREGFVLRGVMTNYLRDPKSHNFASLLEWTNPDYKGTEDDVRKCRVACVQYQMRKVKSFAEFSRQITYFVDIASDYQADYVLLPELVTVQLLSATEAKSPQEGMQKLSEYTPRYVKLLTDLARKYKVTIIGGSHPSYVGTSLLNVCYVCMPNGEVVEQPKIHVTPNERRWWGIKGGNALRIIDTPKARIGVLICYDVEFPEAARFLADQGAEIIFVPFCTDTRQGYLRVRYCAQARAIENQIYLAMAGNVGNLPNVANMDIQYAQSCILTPCDFPFARDGIAAEATENVETLTISDVNLADLAWARAEGTVRNLADRRFDLYRIEWDHREGATQAEPGGPPPLHRHGPGGG